jgi:glycosyltransferase involved in cell wall biosynthesis
MVMRKLKIAIVVQGRFHAFDLAGALLDRGHDVTIFTNYPKWAVRRFGFPTERVRGFWLHGLTTRIASKLSQRKLISNCDERLHILFGRTVAAELIKQEWDIVHTWSSVSEEILKGLAGKQTISVLMRGSSHISVQAQLLDEEERRTGAPQEHPEAWVIAREEREYQLADNISVLSSFARDSFLSRGVASDKISVLPLGANLDLFRPDPRIIEERRRRILSDQPLRILYVGTLSYRKGLSDLAEIFRSLGRGTGHEKQFIFRCVGPVASEAGSRIEELKTFAEFIPPQPHQSLGEWYNWGDIFIFPTIEDGYALVLTQASANGLPILTTTNSAGPDFLEEGDSGWVLPIRSPKAFIERLLWCESHRAEVAEMVQGIYENFQPRDWTDVAADFETICLEALAARGKPTDRAQMTAHNR